MDMVCLWRRHELTNLQRTRNSGLLKMLSYMRFHQPKPEHMNELCFKWSRLTEPYREPRDNIQDHVAAWAEHIVQHPITELFTVQKSLGQLLNDMVTQHFFRGDRLSGLVHVDATTTLKLFSGMTVMIQPRQVRWSRKPCSVLGV